MIALGLVWAAIKRGAGAVARHPWMLAVAAAVWWLLRNRARLERTRAELADTRTERDAAAGRAAVAEATTAATVEVSRNQEAGAELAEEIHDAAAPAASPAARVRAVDARVREIARREGADAGGGRPAALRDAPAAAPARGSGRRDPER